MTTGRSSGPGRDPLAGREIIVEFHALGGVLKATAADLATGVEVSVMGPRSAGQDALQALALRKLARGLGLAAPKAGAASSNKKEPTLRKGRLL